MVDLTWRPLHSRCHAPCSGPVLCGAHATVTVSPSPEALIPLSPAGKLGFSTKGRLFKNISWALLKYFRMPSGAKVKHMAAASAPRRVSVKAVAQGLCWSLPSPGPLGLGLTALLWSVTAAWQWRFPLYHLSSRDVCGPRQLSPAGHQLPRVQRCHRAPRASTCLRFRLGAAAEPEAGVASVPYRAASVPGLGQRAGKAPAGTPGQGHLCSLSEALSLPLPAKLMFPSGCPWS